MIILVRAVASMALLQKSAGKGYFEPVVLLIAKKCVKIVRLSAEAARFLLFVLNILSINSDKGRNLSYNYFFKLWHV